MNSEERQIFSLFSDFAEEFKKTNPIGGLGRSKNSKVLIIDGLNTFIRCFVADPSINDDGLHVGGTSGFLKSIGYAIKVIKPTRCIIVFDGEGGSVRRRKIYTEYKNRRKCTVRLNRTYEELNKIEEERKVKQLIRLIDYLRCLPLIHLIIDCVEADDVIAYCAVEYFKKSNIVIMSSDKDFLQLVNNRIKVWSPSYKKMFGPAEIVEKYNIHPDNFLLYRCMDGDISDNIGGIHGAGTKTIVKCFPFITGSCKISLNEVVSYSKENIDKYKLYKSVVENESILYRNYELMQLSNSILSTPAQIKIYNILNSKNVPKLNMYGFVKLMTEDKMWNVIENYGNWLTETFSSLNVYSSVKTADNQNE
jgi:5'-3' exonuclease